MTLFTIKIDPIDLTDRFHALIERILTLVEFGQNSKLDSIERKVDLIMTSLNDLQVSVDKLTTEVAENNALLDKLQASNAEKDAAITDLRAQIVALTVSNAEKDALLAGLDSIKAKIDEDAAALDARQDHTGDVPPAPEA